MAKAQAIRSTQQQLASISLDHSQHNVYLKAQLSFCEAIWDRVLILSFEMRGWVGNAGVGVALKLQT
ncbi:hypothetical protein NC998_21635 [Trichocoleus desertorum GB2-A4]|uniref:Uncharacterized protein n=1 Tax=Trichocoleus desertorum GB2-A4 TaxID=2933944 RepID=A0ABV0JD43_9CYAN|nr:hypothetical protein [Trichocoleus sp. FACHB-46]